MAESGDNMNSALILVDIQNDFLPEGALAVREGDQVIGVANALTPSGRFDLIVATQDWHPRDHASFAANHPGKRIGDVIDLDGLPQVLWPVHCVQGTAGADLAPALERSRIDRVFQKGTDRCIDSYSGLYDNGHRRSTGLGEFLRDQGVSDVYVMGLATDYCVKFTALDAAAKGFKTHLIEDGCRGVDLKSGDVARAIEDMRRRGIEIIRSQESGERE
jgi:nicotinamidase/pyrazinamidase